MLAPTINKTTSNYKEIIPKCRPCVKGGGIFAKKMTEGL